MTQNAIRRAGTRVRPAVLAIVALALIATSSPRVGGVATAQAQTPVCFNETGFCIGNTAFQNYFNARGGARILGFPVSSEFALDGFTVQFFQRVVLQLQGDSVQRLNVLDEAMLPLTRANGSVFPQASASLAQQAPRASDPDYVPRLLVFLGEVVPDVWEGQPVRFRSLFNNTVPVETVAEEARTPELMTLLNLEIWGLPTSSPQFDPANSGFIYQRFQRGIMHYRSDCQCSDGVLVGDYFKQVLTGRDLPDDLAADVRDNHYLGVFDPSTPQGAPFVPPGQPTPPPIEPGPAAPPVVAPPVAGGGGGGGGGAGGGGGGGRGGPQPKPTSTFTPVPPPTFTPTQTPTAMPIPVGALHGNVTWCPEPSSISGCTSSNPLRAANGARVEVIDLPGLMSQPTGADGNYRIDNIPWGQHSVIARMAPQNGFFTSPRVSQLFQVSITSSSTTLDMQLGEYTPARTNLDAVILKGTVTLDGAPVEGATVWRLDEPSRTTTEADGSFELVHHFLPLQYVGGADGTRPASILAVKGNRWGVVTSPNDNFGATPIALDRLGAPTPPMRVLDLVATADTAAWSDNAIVSTTLGPGGLPVPTLVLPVTWNAAPPDPTRGYARWTTGAVMEDDSHPTRVLDTQPRQLAQGEVRGLYSPTVTLLAGDVFTARVGFIKVSPPPSGAIIPKLVFSTWFIPDGTGTPQQLSSNVKIGGIIPVEYGYSGALKPLAGGEFHPPSGTTQQTGRVLLVLSAGATLEPGDKGVWMDAQIVRNPR